MSADQDDPPKTNRICAGCIGEAYLRGEVEKSGAEAECTYCEETGKTISIDELADYVDRAFENHYQVTSAEPSSLQYIMMKEGDYEWEREGETASYMIQEAAHIDEQPAEDVREVLADRHYDFDDAAAGEPFDEESHFAEKDVSDAEFQEYWRVFECSLKTEARLFNQLAEDVLSETFEGLADHATRAGRAVIVKAGPGRRIGAIYRARVFQSDKKLEQAIKRPDIELAPPPPEMAVAGRMNARGIAVFYGATNPRVALAEVRPPVGSKVLVGRFEITRDLRLLDVEALRSIYVKGSIFDPFFIERLEKAKFLESLSHRITMPVLPDDEPFEYIVTQAISDYLATRTEPELDGIVFPSVQNGGSKRNVVLFHKAARVELLNIPTGTEISAHTYDHSDDGSEPDYRVFEETPPEKKKQEQHSESLLGFGEPFPSFDEDRRNPALRLDMESLKVHHVEAVKFKDHAFKVHRHRSDPVSLPVDSLV